MILPLLIISNKTISAPEEEPPPPIVFTDIYFDEEERDNGQATISGAMAFNRIESGAVAGNRTILSVIADGENVPDISEFKHTSFSEGYDNTEGIENFFDFLFDGVDYWVTIFR